MADATRPALNGFDPADPAFRLFAGGVAHDFSNFLTIISGFAQLLRAQYKDDAELAESLREILVACERGGGMIEQLAVLAAQRPMQLASVTMPAGLEAMLPALRARAGEGLTLEWQPGAAAALRADAARLQQVFELLCEHARAELPKGGMVRLSGPAGANGREAELVFQIVGCAPLKPELLGAMFQPFHLKTYGKRGYGLGLAVAHALVAQHGGRLTAESAPTTGLTFHLFLPLAS